MGNAMCWIVSQTICVYYGIGKHRLGASVRTNFVTACLIVYLMQLWAISLLVRWDYHQFFLKISFILTSLMKTGDRNTESL